MTNKQEEIKGRIFDIERFSTKDGPGIRTVVFFKGCNMHCYWCHNPESIGAFSELKYDDSKCIGCLECMRVCPSNAHIIENQKHKIDRDLCTSCFACADACYSGALQLAGKSMTVEEVMAEILEDKQFYIRSGGGVTLSGGEVMLQSCFASKLLKRCKEENIHTAIDTNMSMEWKFFMEVLPYTDLVIADIKCMDSKLHQKATGKTNYKVLSNIKRIGKIKKPFIVRTPVIPGFNDNEGNIHETARFLKQFDSLIYYELLSYNPLGESKSIMLGKPMNSIEVPSREAMKNLANIAKKEGIKVVLDGKSF